ncbi:hypothetical protein MSBRW_2702 [Methanosarcina barkeri str. Wiesmoor]|uniref:Uncharacterized protein n=1 Tax=Methanosarcina barkeri str. Wiesmoor TaxID=1434109 RepID=A0A0E3QP79_METBA|nr:hypothetical protein MSBRW_2702 [Methanosarcina barkeri str. Wiesmoor]
MGIRTSNSNVAGIFGQAFFEKGCVTTVARLIMPTGLLLEILLKLFFEKTCVTSVDHAVVRNFRSSLFEKGCKQAVFSKSLQHRFIFKGYIL